eukprot:EG_transcript_12181
MGSCCCIHSLTRFHDLDGSPYSGTLGPGDGDGEAAAAPAAPGPSSSSPSGSQAAQALAREHQQQLASLRAERKREAEALQGQLKAREAEWARLQKGLQRQVRDLEGQLRTAQASLRLLSLREEAEGSVGRHVEEARLALLYSFMGMLEGWHARARMRNAFATWLAWLRHRHMLDEAVFAARHETQLRAVQELAAVAHGAIRSTCYQRWVAWTHQRRHQAVLRDISQAPRVLQVVVRRAVKLVVDSKFKFGNPDPYVCLVNGKTRIQTGVQKSTINPIWEETHMLALDPHVLAFRVEVFDFEKRLSHNLIAAQDVLFGELPAGRTVELTLPLKVRHGHEWQDAPDTMLYLGLMPRGPGWR